MAIDDRWPLWVRSKLPSRANEFPNSRLLCDDGVDTSLNQTLEAYLAGLALFHVLFHVGSVIPYPWSGAYFACASISISFLCCLIHERQNGDNLRKCVRNSSMVHNVQIPHGSTYSNSTLRSGCATPLFSILSHSNKKGMTCTSSRGLLTHWGGP